MGHSTPSHPVRNPGPFKVSSGLQGLFAVFALIGLIAFVVGLNTDSKRAWFSFVHNHFYFMGIALTAAFFSVVQFLTGAMWSAPIRRITESFTSYIPVALVTFIALYFGLHSLYHWTHPEVVAADQMLQGKASWLNINFFMIRNVIYLLLMIFLVRIVVGNSIKQDSSKDPALTQKNRSLAPVFLIIFALGFTMAAWDQIMSLDPHWFSTMLGVYAFAGSFYAVLAATGVLVVLLKRAGALQGIVNDNHLHDIGKFMFAFTVFWAYIGFSQFMLIWYANLPEETRYYLLRFNGKWGYVSVFVLVCKFMVPFFALLKREAKRSEKVILAVGSWMLFAHWIDVLWMSQPEFHRDGPSITWMEPLIALGFLGVFGLIVSRFLGKHNIVAIGDPKLEESMHHDQ